jgi:hypothetical protein
MCEMSWLAEELLACQEDKAPRCQDNRHVKVIRLSALHTGRFYPFTFLLEAESTSEPQCSRKDLANKNLMKPLGIEPASSRLVAQCLSQLLHLPCSSSITASFMLHLTDKICIAEVQ